MNLITKIASGHFIPVTMPWIPIKGAKKQSGTVLFYCGVAQPLRICCTNTLADKVLDAVEDENELKHDAIEVAQKK